MQILGVSNRKCGPPDPLVVWVEAGCQGMWLMGGLSLYQNEYSPEHSFRDKRCRCPLATYPGSQLLRHIVWLKGVRRRKTPC